MPLGPSRERCVLAVLLLEANRAVSVERLIDLVWNDRPPVTARRTLHAYLCRLRRRLRLADPDAQEVDLRTAGASYLLSVDAGKVDVHHFRILVQRAGETDDALLASALLREALDLWQGPPLADVTNPRLQEEVCAALLQERLDAEEQLVESQLRSGRHQQALAALYPLVARHPTRERLTEQLMRALCLSGRRSDALTAYQRTRLRLAEELGVDPAPALTALHRAVLRGDPTPNLSHL